HFTSARGDFIASYGERSQRVLTSGRTGVRLWDTGESVPLAYSFPNGGGGIAAKLSADGRFLVVGCGDGTARVWDLISTEDGRPFLEHSDTIYRLSLSADGQRLYTACADATVGFWNAQAGRPIVDEFPRHQAKVRRVGLSDDQRYLFATDW